MNLKIFSAKYFGIKHKLFAAFSMTVGSTLLASTVAYFAFFKLSESVSHITDQSVPMMANSMELTQYNFQLDGLVPVLASASDNEERASVYENTQLISEKMKSLASGGGSSSDKVSSESVESSESHTAQTDELLSILNHAVEERLSSETNFNELLQMATDSQYQIDTSLKEIIEEASGRFIKLAGDTFEENTKIVDDMLKVHLESMFNALKLKVQATEVAAIAVNSLNTNTSESLKTDSFSMISSMAKMNLNREQLLVRQIPNIKKLDKDLSYLRDVLSVKDGIYAKPYIPVQEKQRIDLIAGIRAAEQRINKVLNPAIESGRFKMNLSGEDLNESSSITLPALINDGVDQLINLVQLRAELNTQKGLLAQVSQAVNQEGLERLQERYTVSEDVFQSTQRKIRGVKGFRKIKKAIRVLSSLVIGDNGIFNLKNSAISHQGKIESTEKLISKTQSENLKFLLEQARNNKDSVIKSGIQVSDLISKSLTWLAGISAACVLVTVLVYWLVVSKGLLKRLMVTISALRSLASGDYEVSVDCSGSDELTDLARTVEVFRKNSIDAQRLADEQAELAAEKAQRDELERVQAAEQHREEVNRHKKEQDESRRKNKAAAELQTRVDRLLMAVSAAAEGDLDHPIDTSGNDLAAQMAKALDALFKALKKSMVNINENAGYLTSASGSLSKLSIEMKEMSASNTSISKDATELVTEVGRNVESVAGATDELLSSISEIARSTNKAETVAEQAVTLAVSTDKTMRKLVESSGRIGSVIKVITTIAEQTNLLALNATIEAARAGEAGKGFAVVANEVKELAKETSMATEKIEQRISEIQTDTSSAVEAIHSISETINEISEIQSVVTDAIGGQSIVTREISKSIAETATSANGITSIIVSVADKAVLNQQASEDINSAAVDLSNMAGDLQALVSLYSKNKVAANENDQQKRIAQG